MTTTIVTRAGKGSELTWAEMDANVTNLQVTADAAMTAVLNLNMFRNRLANGDMQVSQINGSTAVTPTASSYPIDQWKATISQASNLTFQRITSSVPAGFKYSYKVSVAVQYAPLAADVYTISQPVEGQHLIDLALGSAAPSTIAVSVYAKSSVPGTYACFLQNGAGNRSYVGTITLTNSWARYTVVLVGDNTGTWANDNTAGLWFGIDLGSGSNSNATAGAWAAGAFTRTSGTISLVNQVAGSALYFTGAQIEEIPAGTVTPTAFEFLPYMEQFFRCQRYLPVFNSLGTTYGVGTAFSSTTTNMVLQMPFVVPARVPPTGVAYSAANVLSFLNYAGTAYAGSAIAMHGNATHQLGMLNVTIATATAGQVGTGYFNTNGAYVAFTGCQM